MALGTNYRRNQSSEDNAIRRRIEKALAMASEIRVATGCRKDVAEALGARVVMGRISKEDAIKEASV